MDVGWKALVLPEDSAKLKKMNKTEEMAYALYQRYRGGSMKTGRKMYDSCAMAYLLCPEMYTVVETYLDIELNGSMTAGCTLVDLKGYLKQPKNAKVCIDIDTNAFRTWFLNAIKKCI